MSEDTRAIVAAVLAAAAVTGHTTVEHLIPIYEKALEQLAEAEKRQGDADRERRGAKGPTKPRTATTPESELD